MKRSNFLLLTLVCLLFGGIKSANAQIALQYTDTTLCPGQPLTMCAALTGLSTDITADDKYCGVLELGFSFTFFDKVYTKCIVSSNGMITFDTTMANQYGANWQWGQASSVGFNGVTQANNSIMAAFVDLLPTPTEGRIRYQRFGQPGNRRFVVEWCNLGIYAGTCSALKLTTELILYEGSNTIEIHTTQVPPMSFSGPCPSASAGYYAQVVQGVRNDNGSLSFYPANRNPVVSATNWGVTGVNNDAMRFTPNGAATYMMDPIPYNPWVIIDETSSPDLKWYAEGEPNLPVATGACASVITEDDVNYYVVRFNGNAGCFSTLVNFSDTVRIHFGTEYDTTDVEICAGTTYSWFGNNLFKAGNYDTLLKTMMGCDSFIRLRLFVNPLPDVVTKGSLNVEICEGSSTVISLLNPASGTTYQWYKDGSPVAGETSYQMVVSVAGKYKVEATTAKGCKAMSNVFTLVVNPNPVADIKPMPNEIACAYDTTDIAAVPGAGYEYRWSPEKPFRIVTGPEGEKVKGIFIDPVNDVVLTVYNQFGCYDTASIKVYTKACCEVFVPNAFSPNKDGLNEFFQPQLQLGQIMVSMQVFDRYGKLVYNNTNVKKGWDGTYEGGDEAPGGVYMYMMKYTCADGKLYEKKESVSLIR
jgi:gliding motility-associated-like protein